MSKIDGKILVLDDDQGVLFTAKLILNQHFETVVTEGDPLKLDILLNEKTYDVIVLDINFSYGLTGGKEGIKLLKRILEKDPKTHVLMNTNYGDIDRATEALKEGAIDFLVKPWQKEKLLATVQSIYALSQKKKQLDNAEAVQKIVFKDQQKEFEDIISVSPAMEPVFKAIDKVAQTDANVLLLGENGTGKELIARTIHNRSSRFEENFIKIDLSSIPESKFESELFGYVKGAFSEADKNKPGRFEMADKGTIFFEEMGDLSLSLQAKVLTAIQFKQVSRSGSDQMIPLDTRFMCATNMSIDKMVIENEFRQDLLQLLNTIEVNIPPLRERIEDIEPLTRHFVKLYSKKYKKGKIRLNQTTLSKLEAYAWPGNVRELQLAIERALISSRSRLLAPEDFLLTERPSENVIASDSFNMEKIAIQNAIRNAEGNLTKAAKELGLGRSTLYRKMEKYRL